MARVATISVRSRFLGFRRSVSEEDALNVAFDFAEKNAATYVSHTFDGDETVTVTFTDGTSEPGVRPALAGLIVVGIIVIFGGGLLTWNVIEVTDALENPVNQLLVGLAIAVAGLWALSSLFGKK